MFSRNSFLAGCLISAAAFTTGFATARTAEEGPAIKSHHLFNLPSSVSEADLAAALWIMNTGVAEAGYDESLWGKYGCSDVDLNKRYGGLHYKGRVKRSVRGPHIYVFPDESPAIITVN